MVKNAIKTLVFSVSLGIACLAIAQDNPTRSITQIAGDVYRFQNNFHHSLVVLTNEGVVVVDPIKPGGSDLVERRTEKTD